jgi:uncharacterized LabA/DUF88 family protein
MALCRRIFPANDIVRIKYFTALITLRPDDPNKPSRQKTYLRALQTLPDLSIYYGHFLAHVVRMHLANPEPGQDPFVKVIKTEEKGTDVNLATELLVDAWSDAFDCAVVISGDSDLTAPVKVVNERFKKTVGVLNPQQKPSFALKKVAGFYKHIRESALQASQFPPELVDDMGSFHKPASW